MKEQPKDVEQIIASFNSALANRIRAFIRSAYTNESNFKSEAELHREYLSIIYEFADSVSDDDFDTLMQDAIKPAYQVMRKRFEVEV